MSSPPVETLEQRAMEQRRRLHETTTELRAKIAEKREQFDLKHMIRRHLPAAAMIAAAVGLLAGYSVGDSFARH